MPSHTARTFEVPAALVATGFASTTDLDVLDREVEFPGDFGDWAEKVLLQENAKILDDVCGTMRLLPRGILSSIQLDDGSLIIDGLVDSDGRVWDKDFSAWGVPSEPINIAENTIELDDDDVAFVARAFREGADEVWHRPFIPKAFVSALVAAPPPPQDRLGRKGKKKEDPPTNEEVPAGSAIIAVVDPIDEDAVLEMLAITPGPRALRRHDGSWFDDPAWVPVLRSVRPPKIVKLSEAQVASVTTQVDRATADQDWEPFDADSREQYQIFTASAYVQELQRESDEQALRSLIAVAGRKLTPQDAASTERLNRYWTVGKGAAKIRWGTPGSWRRCYKHLVVHVGPKIAPGLCTNLSKRLGGPGIATHVTSSADVLVAANPTGENGYDNGQTFNESSVDRGYAGRFSSGGGADRSARAERRKKSMARSKKGREEKENKSSETAVNKAERERKAAERKIQQEELSQISLEISELTAAGDTIGAAELRVRRAERRLAYADTSVERLNAQAGLNNAIASLERAKRAARRRRDPSEAQRRSREDYDTQYRQLEPEFQARHGRDGLSNVP